MQSKYMQDYALSPRMLTCAWPWIKLIKNVQKICINIYAWNLCAKYVAVLICTSPFADDVCEPSVTLIHDADPSASSQLHSPNRFYSSSYTRDWTNDRDPSVALTVSPVTHPDPRRALLVTVPVTRDFHWHHDLDTSTPPVPILKLETESALRLCVRAWVWMQWRITGDHLRLEPWCPIISYMTSRYGSHVYDKWYHIHMISYMKCCLWYHWVIYHVIYDIIHTFHKKYNLKSYMISYTYDIII